MLSIFYFIEESSLFQQYFGILDFITFDRSDLSLVEAVDLLQFGRFLEMFLIMVFFICSMLIHHVEMSVKSSYDETSVKLAYKLEMLEMVLLNTFRSQLAKLATQIFIYLLLIFFWNSLRFDLSNLVFFLLDILLNILIRRL